MEVSYSAIRGSLEVVPALTQDPGDTGSSCFLVFDGVDLTEDVLRDWLRLCTTQVMAAPWVAQHHPRWCGPVFIRLPSQAKKTKNHLSPQEVKHVHVSPDTL